jgi:protein-L-isoaspartate O-methyltransferase
VEIGCGTGGATVTPAQLWCSIVAVESSADMAAIARQDLAGQSLTQAVVSAFGDRITKR